MRFVAYLTPAAATLVIFLGSVVLLEWAINSLWIARIRGQFIPTAPSTAICFVLLGLDLLCRRQEPLRGFIQNGLRAMAWIVAIFSSVVFLQFVLAFATGLSLDIEQWIALEPTVAHGLVLGRMSLVTSSMFVMLSVATLLSFPPREMERLRRTASQGFAAIAFIFAIVLITGYLYGTPLLYGIAAIPVALPTAMAFFLLSFGLLFDGPDSWLYRLAASDSVFARFTRIAVPGSAVIILVGGWFGLRFLSGADPTYRVIAVALTALLTAAMVAFLMSLVAKHVEIAANHAQRALLDREEALRTSEKNYRDLVENLNDVIFRTNLDGVFTYVSPPVERVAGYQPSELVGVNYAALVHEDDLPEVGKSLQDVIGGRLYPSDFRVRTKTGDYRWLRTSSRPLFKDGTVVGIQGIAFDISESKRAESFLRESEQRYRTVFTLAAEAILIVHPEGKILDANPACEVFLGVPLGEIIGANIVRFYWDPKDRVEFRKRLEAKGILVDFDLMVRRSDGTLRHCMLNSSVWKTDDGTPVAYVSVARDLTEAKILEAQLRHSQKMEAVGTLAGGVAHDFNNLLTVINGYAELLLADKSADDPEFEDLRRIQLAGRRGAELVRMLLAFGRKAERQPRPLNLNLHIQRIRDMLERTIPKMIAIETDLDNNLAVVGADPTQVEQIIMNLAVNAKDAMPDGGKLTIATRNAILDEDYCRLHPDAKPGRYAMLEVSDNGKGMDQETLQHVFEPFYTTKAVGKGTGLGLAMVYGIVKQHDGHIYCYSEPGLGTTFRIYFPVGDQEAEEAARRTESVLPLGTETVLVVDDEQDVRALCHKLLTRAGYQVLTASNGLEALEVFEQERQNIALVILDVIMPEMGGKECFARLRQMDPSVKVLMASGYASGGTANTAEQLGADGFVSKPYRVAQLLRVVRETLDAG